jgi:hypothetical protein
MPAHAAKCTTYVHIAAWAQSIVINGDIEKSSISDAYCNNPAPRPLLGNPIGEPIKTLYFSAVINFWDGDVKGGADCATS